MFGIENTLDNTGVIAALIILGCLIFIECAFLIGLFVPGGDVLVVVSGVFTAESALPLEGVLAVIFVATVAGYEVSYYIGRKAGPRILKQKGGMLFRKEYAERTVSFYARHGAKIVVIARFPGYVRTIVPLLAGITQMPHAKFTFYNIVGALLWTIPLVLLGYWLGSGFAEMLQRYTLPIALIGLALLCSPTIIHLVRGRRKRTK